MARSALSDGSKPASSDSASAACGDPAAASERKRGAGSGASSARAPQPDYRSYPRVAAVVAHDDPTDSDPNTESYAHYTLAINGTVQPGG